MSRLTRWRIRKISRRISRCESMILKLRKWIKEDRKARRELLNALTDEEILLYGQEEGLL